MANRASRRRKRRVEQDHPPRRAQGGAVLRMMERGVWVLVLFSALIVYIASGLPDTRTLWSPPAMSRVTLLDHTGRQITERGLTYSGDVHLDALPTHVIHAVLAAEDRRFFDHFGLDLRGLMRAMAANMQAGHIVQGGSTITQQLAKNLFLSPERTLRRKLQEAMLALYLEARLTKDQILTLYLNRVYFGAGTHGIEAAARRYFGKPPTQLTLGEAAMLAGLLKAPSRYAPTANKAGAEDRARVVLAAMEDAGFISETQRVRTARRAVRIQKAATPGVHFFADWVLNQIPDYIGPHDGRIIVETSLDIAMQKAAERAVAAVMDQAGVSLGADEAALTALTPNGAVRVMVGGRSYRTSQFNRAVQARRQPGSAFKPFVYVAALERGLHPDDLIADEPITIGQWTPENFSDHYQGPVTLTQALAESLNAATVRLGERVGRSRVIDTAKRFGLDGAWQPIASLPLGTVELTPLDLTAGYAPFINGGIAVMPSPILRIRTEDGTILFEREGSGLGRVASPDTLAALDEMLQAAVTYGTGRRAALTGRRVAGKTGTSQNYRDAWFIGYTQSLVAGVWVGNDDNRPMEQVTGGTLPAAIWRSFMDQVKSDPETDDLFLTVEKVPQKPASPSITTLLLDLAGRN